MPTLTPSDFIKVRLDHPRGEVCLECGFPFDTDSRVAYVNRKEQMVFCSKACIERSLADFF